MAVEAFAKPNMMDDMDEDEAPLVFKRNSKQNQLNSSQKLEGSPRVTVAESRPLKQNQSNSQAKKIITQKLEGQSGIIGSESRPVKQNQQNSEAKKTTSLVSESRPFKQNQSNSHAKNVNSQKLEGKPGNLASSFGSLNGQNSSLQKGKMVPCLKSSPVKSPLTSPKASFSSANTSPVVNSRASSSASDQPKNAAQRDGSTLFEGQKPSIESSYAPNSDSEDSEDNKPLSARLPAGVPKGNSNNIKRGSSTSNLSSGSVPKTGVKHENSDDEMPLSSKFLKSNAGTSTTKSDASDQQKAVSSKLEPSKPLSKSSMKSNAGVSVNKYDDSDEEKPLSSKLQQNGSTRDSQLKKSSSTVNKRPISDVKSSDPSSVKKPKLSDTSTLTGFKKESMKEETRYDGDDDDDDDHVPISQRMKKSATPVNKSTSAKPKVTKVISSSLKTSKKSKKVIKKSKYSKPSKVPPGSGEGQKWTTLIHNGVIFPPPYKPHGVNMLYKGKPIDLTSEQEEVATMYAVMLDTDYMNKPKFKENFMMDWRKILGKNHVIRNLEDCDFTPIYEWHQKEKEKKKQMSTEEKKTLKEEKLKQEEKYMWAIVDGVKEKVGNFRVEPPGLFRGRGEHPKMGKLKKRIRPSDITINIGKNAPIPECPIPGESWKEIRHDNTVTWLAFWNDPINPKEFKYVFLAASSSLKGQSDKEKYEKARLLKDYIHGIRAAYTKNFTTKDVTKQQIAVATYLIDKLALRAGNEKDDDEADTVGCCTLKVENVEPIPPNILKFDFLGKDSIRYQNDVEVELAVFKAIQKFRTGKRGSDDLFDMLDTGKLNAHLKELMPGLTAKVFRTYNASITLDEMLIRETKGGDVAEKVVIYQHANKEVAIICNHQRSVSKSHSAQMLRLDEKIEELKRALEVLKTDLARAKKGKPPLKSTDGKPKRNLSPEVLERKIAQANVRLEKAERDKETKEDLKTVALGTSKINYLDPRITVAWCKRNEVPIEKIFNKSLLAKFAWAMDVDPGFRF